jgi:hypothetical protein
MNAGATFQRKVEGAVGNLKAFFAYVDDMDVVSKDAEEHAIHLQQLFTRLREHGLVINNEKCMFGASLQQQQPGSTGWELLAFFSTKLVPAQVKYSTAMARVDGMGAASFLFKEA